MMKILNRYFVVLCAMMLVNPLHAQDLFMAVTKNGNTGYVMKSTDGGKTVTTVWDGEMEAQTGQNRLYDIAYGDGKIVAVGNMILTSLDKGKSWQESNVYYSTGSTVFPNRAAMKCVTYGQGFFVAAGKFHIIYSKDGVNWKFVRTGQKSIAEKRNEGTSTEKVNPRKLSKLSLKDLKKKAKEKASKSTETKSEKSTSAKGEIAPDVVSGLKTPLDMLYAKGKFYLVGGNMNMEGKILAIQGDKIVVEQDMDMTGNAAKINTGGLKSITWDGQNTLLACSNSTKSAYSTDMGKTWKYIFNPNKSQIWGVAYGDGKWVAASPFSDIFISTDISTKWTESLKRGGGRGTVSAMIHDGTQFILVGGDIGIFTSKNAKDWERITPAKYGYHLSGITIIKD